MDVLSNKVEVEIKEYSSNEPEEEPLRLGRRESEPHSYEVTYLFGVLTPNFEESRVLWDLHHYFYFRDEKWDIQFDVSLFNDLEEPEDISSYDSAKYNNQVPDMTINVLSGSTARKDIYEIDKKCELLRIPIYIIFTPYDVAPDPYVAPFLQVFILDNNMVYRSISVDDFAAKQGVAGFDSEKMISLAPKFNLSVGLELLKRTYKGGLARFRLFFVDLTKNERLYTKEEMSEQRADKEKARADKEKVRADKAEARADKAENKVEELETEIKKLKDLLRKKN